jgi:hypothetical protein
LNYFNSQFLLQFLNLPEKMADLIKTIEDEDIAEDFSEESASEDEVI